MTYYNSSCPVETTLQLISSRWKVLILRDLLEGTRRFGEPVSYTHLGAFPGTAEVDCVKNVAFSVLVVNLKAAAEFFRQMADELLHHIRHRCV